MAQLVEIEFKGNRKEFFLWGGDVPLGPRTPVIVEADRGEDLGRVHAVGDLAQLRIKGCTHGTGGAEPTQKVIRVASNEDVRKLAELRAQDDGARREASALVTTHSLPMKLTDAEWRWDRRKLTVYFTAEKRVDFRSLVRDLASKFRARIELKQIGVRDEAKRLDGVGRCGRQYCSASWLTELRPVNLGLAKDQKLSLNPTQISGACGRLMCCLRYEHDWYVETRRRFPKEGKVVTTSAGEERVIANDLFRERVTLRRVSDGEARVISLEQLNRELRGEPVETDAETEALPMEAWSEEILAMTDTVERPIPAAMIRAMQQQRAAQERPVTIERAPSRGEGRETRDAGRDAREGGRDTRDAGRAATSRPVSPDSRPAAKSEEQGSDGSEQEQQRKSRRRRGRRGGRKGGRPNQPPSGESA